MSIRPIVISGNPVLHRPAARVTEFDDALRDLIADMHETMDASHGVGLAAPQIGVSLRIFTYIFENEDGVAPRGTLVNPVLTTGKISEKAPDPDEEAEGCLSVPSQAWPLKRADWIRIAGQDGNGDPVAFEATGWFARVMQHEYDHLDGKLYVDRLNPQWSRKARKAIAREKWGTDSSWLPGVDEDPFGH